jgi:alkaline phosphatase D
LPAAIYSAAAVFFPSFLISSFQTVPYEVIVEEVDITITENEASKQPPEPSSTASDSQTLRNEDSPDEVTEEIEVEDIAILQERGPQLWQTLLLGLPSPRSTVLNVITTGINLLLVLAVVDIIYRAPLLHPSHDLSFARVGFVSDRSARILLREPDPKKLPVFLSYRKMNPTQQDDAWKAAGRVTTLTNETDFTSALEISRLSPENHYQYVFSNDHTGYFTTAPRPGYPTTLNGGKYTFLTTSCIKPRFPYNPFSHPLHIPGLDHLSKLIPTLHAQFMLFLGDFIYIDVPHRFGSTIETYRREYRQVYSSPSWAPAASSLPWLHVIDDHEIANDWDSNTTGIYSSAIDPYTHYHASVNPPTYRNSKTYYTFTQGPASFFLLDTRRYRDPEFSQPANSSSKTMLGAAQLADLLSFLRAPTPSGVRWKIIGSSIPFTKNWKINAMDTWAGYLHERQTILSAMWDTSLKPHRSNTATSVRIIILSGDRHEFAATAFPPPKGSQYPPSATVHEFSTSPLSMFYLPIRTYWQSKGDDDDVAIKYIPDGNSKLGAVEIESPHGRDGNSTLRYRLFVDGKEKWSYLLTSPSKEDSARGGTRDRGRGKGMDSLWE